MHHGLDGVLDEIHECLLNLSGIERRGGEIVGKVFVEHHSAVFNLGAKHRESVHHDVIKRNRLALRTSGADGLQELADDIIEPIDFAF